MEARECGRTAAVAGVSARRMQGWAREYPELYGGPEFDATTFGTLAMASAFSGPWYTAAELGVANKACLWAFGLDWLIDRRAGSAEDVRDLVGRVAEVADGADPHDELTALLAALRDEVGPHRVWREELQLMLDAMALEWTWKQGARPTFEDYLANADNLGFSFVFACHWTVNGGDGDERAVREASWAVQRVIRLLNDLGTYERDLKWGDLNALMLDVDPAKVEHRITELITEAERLCAPLPARHGDYMLRQIEFCAGFYGVTDFWGATG